MEIAIDDYFMQQEEIKNACNDANTNRQTLQNALQLLQAIEAEIDDQASSMNMEQLNFALLTKFVLFQSVRKRNIDLLANMYTLISIRKSEIDAYRSTHTMEETIEYSNETRRIIAFVDELIENSETLKNLRIVFKQI